jgi:hypothetical protein
MRTLMAKEKQMITESLKNREKESIKNEYDQLIYYEIELFKNRWTVFVTLLSISSIITGFGLQKIAANESNSLLKLICTIGFCVYLVAFYHYYWFHELAHKLRELGTILEKVLNFNIYHIRRNFKPQKLNFPLHWFIYLISITYLLLIIFIWIFK